MGTLTKKTRFWLLYYGGILVFSILTAGLMKFRQTGSIFVPELPLVISTIFLISILIGYLAMYLPKYFSGMPQRKMIRQIPRALIIFVVAAYIIANVVVALGVFAWYIIRDISLHGFFHQLFTRELPYASIRMISGMMFFSLAFFYVLWRKAALNELSLREETLRAQYANLKAGINPHFLFNSLNTLSELVHEDAAKADDYIQKLSSVYRYVIEHENTNLISLKDELEFVDKYFRLQQVRSGEKIILEKQVPDAGDYLTIPVSVQSLVENAVKHNVASALSPLKIELFTDDGYLVVRNTLQRKNRPGISTGTGLENLKHRLSLVMEKELLISETETHFEVRLPLLNADDENTDHRG